MTEATNGYLPREPFEERLAALESGLGAFCFRWLTACAVFPALRLPITLHLGAALAHADGRRPPTETEVFALTALPWFRQGWMPPAWRQALLARQLAGDRDVTRAALAELAHATLDAAHSNESGAVTVARVPASPEGFLRDWTSWREGLPAELAERDSAFEASVAIRRSPRRQVLLWSGGVALGTAAFAGTEWLRARLPPVVSRKAVSTVVLAAFDPNGRYVALAHSDGRITRARTDGIGVVDSLDTGQTASWLALSIGPDGTTIAATQTTILGWCLNCAAAKQLNQAGIRLLEQVSITPDGQAGVYLSIEHQTVFTGLKLTAFGAFYSA